MRPQIERGIEAVLLHGQCIMGPEVKQLEEKLAANVGVKRCITASSGTDTLLIALMALGISPGDEVITTPFTFIATGEMIALLGAKPVFVDIDPRTYNIDPAQVEAAITPRTKAIMPVILFGQCADMDAINAIADKYGLPVIEDAAQSFGATYKGRKSCGLSTIGSTSFFPSKPLGEYGDGGALFTDDDALAKAMREIGVHGQDPPLPTICASASMAGWIRRWLPYCWRNWGHFLTKLSPPSVSGRDMQKYSPHVLLQKRHSTPACMGNYG